MRLSRCGHDDGLYLNVQLGEATQKISSGNIWKYNPFSFGSRRCGWSFACVHSRAFSLFDLQVKHGLQHLT